VNLQTQRRQADAGLSFQGGFQVLLTNKEEHPGSNFIHPNQIQHYAIRRVDISCGQMDIHLQPAADRQTVSATSVNFKKTQYDSLALKSTGKYSETRALWRNLPRFI
jgi:hypothetical protein